jgi:hypothetical protein
MPTDTEVKIMKILNSIEIEPETVAKKIESMGNEAITVLCEAALGSYPGIRNKVRTNSVSLLGWIKNYPQVIETIKMLVADSQIGVSVRAIRSAGRQRAEQVVEDLGDILKNRRTSSIIALEAVKSLIAINSLTANQYLDEYAEADPKLYPHRRVVAIDNLLKERP